MNNEEILIDFPNLFEVLSTINIKNKLIIIAIKILIVSNSARKESKVVKLPGPAIKGNANGKTEIVRAFVSSSLYNDTPKIISKAIKNKIKAPATAKEFTSIPIKFKILFPKNKKAIIITPAIIEAFSDWIFPNFARKSIIIGIFPITSITANNIIVAVSISLKLTNILH